MKKLNFTETFKREDWEPLYGKWFFASLDGPYDGCEIYKITKTECGFAVYRLLSNGCQSEGIISYDKEYTATNVPFTVYQFVDNSVSGKLKPLDESRVGDMKRLMSEFNETRESRRDSEEKFNNSIEGIKERILSLL